jgi:hypothetical protein
LMASAYFPSSRLRDQGNKSSCEGAWAIFMIEVEGSSRRI